MEKKHQMHFQDPYSGGFHDVPTESSENFWVADTRESHSELTYTANSLHKTQE